MDGHKVYQIDTNNQVHHTQIPLVKELRSLKEKYSLQVNYSLAKLW